jgi:hypothetical protein
VVGFLEPVTILHRLRLPACDAKISLNGFWEVNHGEIFLSCIGRGHRENLAIQPPAAFRALSAKDENHNEAIASRGVLSCLSEE